MVVVVQRIFFWRSPSSFDVNWMGHVTWARARGLVSRFLSFVFVHFRII
jgi:hypothetical protein